MVVEMFLLFSEVYFIEISEVVDVDVIYVVCEFVCQCIGEVLFELLWQCYQVNCKIFCDIVYFVEVLYIVWCSLQNIVLFYLLLLGWEEIFVVCLEQYEGCDNMIECLIVLVVLVNFGFEVEKGKVLVMFVDYFKDDLLVMDQWFSVQVGLLLLGGLEWVQVLMQYLVFILKNLNKVCVLIGVFVNQNLVNFYCFDGVGYCFFVDQVIVFNVFNLQIVLCLLVLLICWCKYDEVWQVLMCGELECILVFGELFSDVYEVVSKSLV